MIILIVRHSLAFVFLALDGNYGSRIIVFHSIDYRLFASQLTLKRSATNIPEKETNTFFHFKCQINVIHNT